MRDLYPKIQFYLRTYCSYTHSTQTCCYFFRTFSLQVLNNVGLSEDTFEDTKTKHQVCQQDTYELLMFVLRYITTLIKVRKSFVRFPFALIVDLKCILLNGHNAFSDRFNTISYKSRNTRSSLYFLWPTMPLFYYS